MSAAAFLLMNWSQIQIFHEHGGRAITDYGIVNIPPGVWMSFAQAEKKSRKQFEADCKAYNLYKNIGIRS